MRHLGALLHWTQATHLFNNESVIYSVNSGSSKCRPVMCLIRILFAICVKFNFACALLHFPRRDNCLADVLGRDRIQLFNSLHPMAEPVSSRITVAQDLIEHYDKVMNGVN